MSTSKQRVTITVEPELLEAGRQAIEAGQASSMSSWISRAVAEKVERDQRLEHLRAAIADYEREFGEITPEEAVAQQRADRGDALVVRGRPRKSQSAQSAR